MLITCNMMKKLIYLHITILLFLGLFTDLLNAYYLAQRVLEFLSVIEVYLAILVRGRKLIRLRMGFPLFMIGFLALYSLIHWLVTLYDAYFFVRGFITAFKYFGFFITCALILDMEDYDRFGRFFTRMLYANAALCTLAYIVGLRGDFCNGFFGIGHMNRYLNVFLCFVCAYNLEKYLHHRMAPLRFVMILLLCMYIAMLSEMKFFYFELALIALIALLMKRPDRKTILIMTAGIVVVIALPIVMNLIWGELSASYFSRGGIQEYVKYAQTFGYASGSDLGRIGGISRINKYFFADQANIYGYGLGYCDYGTPFMNQYENYHFAWFTYLLTYLELGWIGLAAYFALYAGIAVMCLREKKKIAGDTDKEIIYTVGFIFSVLSAALMFYNETMRDVSSLFVWLAISFSVTVNRRTYLEEEEWEMDEEDDSEELLTDSDETAME